MDNAPPPLPSFAGLWKTWFAAVIGGPILLAGCLLAGTATREASNTVAVIAIIIGLSMAIAHLWVSIRLAIVKTKLVAPEKKTGNMIGLLAGLILGGWAIMFAIFFCGCLAALAAQ